MNKILAFLELIGGNIGAWAWRKRWHNRASIRRAINHPWPTSTER